MYQCSLTQHGMSNIGLADAGHPVHALTPVWVSLGKVLFDS